jgi:microcystin-dependent protein
MLNAYSRFRKLSRSGFTLAVFAFCFFSRIADVNAQNNYLGEIKMFAGNFAPTGWAFCDGSLLQISQNTALFSLLGTTYGGNGTSTFALPDLRGRVPVDAGTGTGLTVRAVGDTGGVETVTLSIAQMPSHAHAVTASVDSTVATSDSPQKALPARNASATPTYGKTVNAALAPGAVVVAMAGGSQPHQNMPPYACVNFIIALQGIFPARN